MFQIAGPRTSIMGHLYEYYTDNSTVNGTNTTTNGTDYWDDYYAYWDEYWDNYYDTVDNSPHIKASRELYR